MDTGRWRYGRNSNSHISDGGFGGNIFVGGYFKDSVKFGSNPTLQNFNSNEDAFIAKIAANGTPTWSKQIGNAMAKETISALAVDKATGNFFAIGDFSGQLTLGSDNFTAVGGTDVFLTRFDSDGNPIWSKQFGASNNQNSVDLAVDISGNSLIIGQCNGTINLGQGVKSCNQTTSVFAAKFDSNGTPIWGKIFGNDMDTTEGKSIALDDAGNAFIIGVFFATTDFFTPEMMALSNSGLADTFVAKLDGVSGNAIWSRKFGAAKNEIPASVAVNGNDIFVTGSMAGTVKFNNVFLMSFMQSTDDIFLIGYDSSGNEKCGFNLGGTLAENGMALSIGTNGDLVLAARYNGGPIPIVCTDNATHMGSADAMIVTIKP